MDNVNVHIFLTVFSIKSKDFKKFQTNNKYTFYKYDMCVNIPDINKDKAQVVSNSDNFCAKGYSSHNDLGKRWCFNSFLKLSTL